MARPHQYQATDGIINLSEFELQTHHISLLQKGWNFCPTPRCPNPGQMREDLDKFHRKLKWVQHFATQGNTSSNTSNPVVEENGYIMGTSREAFSHTMFREASVYQPPMPPKPLQTMIEHNLEDFNTRPPERAARKQNLSPEERLALKEILEDERIIPRSADKGSAIVLWARELYLFEGYGQLSKPNYYTPLDHCPTREYAAEINAYVETMLYRGEITESVWEYLTTDNLRTSEFYLLPKIHKNIFPPPGRPIISGNGSPTERISKFVDFFLKPFCPRLPSYVKDTTHLLNILHDITDIPANTLLVTLDVQSLYTNIPNTEGIDAIKEVLNTHRRHPNLKPTNTSLLGLLELVLTRNNFRFNGKDYLQVGGTAMGTRVAPTYAVLFMGQFERNHVYTYNKQPLVYLRYIDDILMLWTHGETELHRFTTHLNQAHPSIKFTVEFSREQIPFLDTLIKLHDGVITTDLHVKPTDTHNYLTYTSAHPQRCKEAIPYSQFLRVRRICTHFRDYQKHTLDLCRAFLQKGYPETLLTDLAVKVGKLDRQTLLRSKPNRGTREQSTTQVHLISTYNPSNNVLPKIAHSNWRDINNQACTRTLHNHKLICGYRRPKNVRELVSRAKVPERPGDNIYNPADPNHMPPSLQPAAYGRDRASAARPTQTQPSTSTQNPPRYRKDCHTPGHCQFCPLLNTTGWITSSQTGKHHVCMKNITCCTCNIVYAITCRICRIQYVGQTKNTIKKRFGGHMGDIKAIRDPTSSALPNYNKPVARHFSSTGHTEKDMSISVLAFIKKPPNSDCSIEIRQRVERNWVHTLRTLAPYGLNKEAPKPYRATRQKPVKRLGTSPSTTTPRLLNHMSHGGHPTHTATTSAGRTRGGTPTAAASKGKGRGKNTKRT